MRVVILGAGTAIPAERYSPAGLYMRVGREHLLFDAGPGTEDDHPHGQNQQ